LSILPGAWLAALHCDEFVVLEHVSDFYRGEFRGAGRPGLLWMALTPLMVLKNPVWITMAARLTALMASAFTLAALWWVSERSARVALAADQPQDSLQRPEPERHINRLPWYGLAAVLLLSSSMDWQGHSFEVRTDTFVLPLTLLAMALLWRAEMSLKTALCAGLIVAATGLISQKSVYNAVGLGAGWVLLTAMYFWSGRVRLRRQLLRALVAVAVALVSVGLWYGLMAWLQQDSGFISAQLTDATKTAFKESIPMRNKTRALGQAIKLAPVLWVSGAFGLILALWHARRRPMWLASACIVAVMLSTIFFHRGFFLYYIASFEPYVALLAGAAVGTLCNWLDRRLSPWAAVGALAVLIGFQVSFGFTPYKKMLAANNEPQISVMKTAVATFPEPVPYWDAIGMIPGYQETTFFGTALLRRWFRKKAGPRGFIERARAQKPHFFIRNYMTRRRYQRAPERKWLWKHYLPYRDNFFLHGGRMKVGPELADQKIELLVSGDYTVWFQGDWAGEAWLDGQRIEHGQNISVTEGQHLIRGRAESGKHSQLWLMLGRDRIPAAKSPEQHVDYSMFTLLARGRYQQYDDKSNERSDLRTPDHDPTIGRVNQKKRHRRHRRWQAKVDRLDGSP